MDRLSATNELKVNSLHNSASPRPRTYGVNEEVGGVATISSEADMARCPGDIPLSSEQVGEGDDGEGLIKITIMEDGHLKVVDSLDHAYYFTPEQLRQRNIDANALTDENIHEIIQLAMPHLLNDGRNADGELAPKRKRSAMDALMGGDGKNETFYSQPTSHQSHGYQQQYGSPSTAHYNNGHRDGARSVGGGIYSGYHQPHSVQSAHNGSALQSSLHAPKVLTSTNFSHFRAASSFGPPPASETRELSDVGIGGLGRVMIGEEMEVKNAEGRVEMATVRYYRPGTGYKIQFADGHFEWLEENSVLEMKHQQSSGHTYSKQPQVSTKSGGFQRISTTSQNRFASMAGGNTQFRRVSQYASTSQPHSSQQHYHQSTNSAASTSADFDENGHKSSIIYHGHSQPHQSQTYASVRHYQPQQYRLPMRQQSAYRDNVVPPNVMGARATVNDDVSYHGGYDVGRQSDDYPPAQNLGDEEIIGLDNGQFQGAEYVGDETAAYDAPNNIYCCVCDRSCPQEQVSFIVVRIPACAGCAYSKVIVMDDEKVTDNGEGTDVSMHPTSGEMVKAIANSAETVAAQFDHGVNSSASLMAGEEPGFNNVHLISDGEDEDWLMF